MDPSPGKCRQILSVSKDASLKEVKEAYIDLAKVWHPDRFAGNPRLEKKATEKLTEINAAYAILVAHLEAGEGENETDDDAAVGEATAPECVRVEDLEPKKAKQARFFSATIIFGILIVLGLGIYFYSLLKGKKADIRAPLITRSLPGPEAPSEPTPGEKPSPKPSRTSKSTADAEKPAPNRKPATDNKFYTLGSTKDEVLVVEGSPQQISDNRWNYGSSYVDFSKGRVTGWHNSALDPLRVRMDTRKDKGEGHFTLGSSKEEVAAIQGTPTQVAGNRWSYGFSRIDFVKGKVAGWYSSTLDPLRVKMTPPEEPERQFFTVGSPKSEVLAVQGTPSQLSENRWSYGYSYVDFEKGKVVRWYNSEQDPLSIESEP